MPTILTFARWPSLSFGNQRLVDPHHGLHRAGIGQADQQLPLAHLAPSWIGFCALRSVVEP